MTTDTLVHRGEKVVWGGDKLLPQNEMSISWSIRFSYSKSRSGAVSGVGWFVGCVGGRASGRPCSSCSKKQQQSTGTDFYLFFMWCRRLRTIVLQEIRGSGVVSVRCCREVGLAIPAGFNQDFNITGDRKRHNFTDFLSDFYILDNLLWNGTLKQRFKKCFIWTSKKTHRAGFLEKS